ncbi:hypothetical protein [Rhizobium sp. PDO1-076]|uniref:hypothetical protein n=1 Tax=Rhizobium sp. PDO1-076 TaxID=1125979 RepID=UPI0011477CD6|nr:hypothetical protein [Rhizobium sp. PDO1-076]
MTPQATWHDNRILINSLLVTSILVGMAVIWSSITGASAEITFGENGPIELLQNVACVVAIVFGVYSARRPSSLKGITAITTVYFALVFLTRETPSCGAPEINFCVVRPTHTYVIVAATIVWLGMIAGIATSRLKDIFIAIHPRTSWPLIVVFLSLVAGQIGEELHMMNVEETLELFAYILLAVCAVWLATQTQRQF